MANGDPRTMTSGSEVADVVQQILARRRDEERQAILDRLAAEDQRSVLEARTAQTDLARASEKRLAEMAASEMAVNAENLRQAQRKTIRPGTRPTDVSDSDLRQWMLNRNMFTEVYPHGPTPEGDTLPPEQVYRGTQDEQDLERRRLLLQQLAAENPDQAAGYQLIEAGGPAVPNLITPQVPMSVFDPDTKEVIEIPGRTISQGQPVDVLPRRPIGGAAAYAPTPYTVTDRASGAVVGSVSLAPSQEQAWLEANPDKMLRPPGFQPSQTAGQVPASLRNAVSRAARDATVWRARTRPRPIVGGLGIPRSETAEREGAEAQLKMALGQLFAADTRSTPEMQGIALRIASHPELVWLPIHQVLSHPEFTKMVGWQNPDGTEQSLQLSESEIAELNRLLNSARGAMITVQDDQAN